MSSAFSASHTSPADTPRRNLDEASCSSPGVGSSSLVSREGGATGDKQLPFADAIIPGRDSMAKDFAIRFLKLVRAELKLPQKYINVMCQEFKALYPERFPRPIGRYGSTNRIDKKVRLSKNEDGIFKFAEGEGIEVKLIIKEVCIYHHLKQLQGTMIPRLLLYGCPDAFGSPGFFLLAECYGNLLNPNQVSSDELGELLHEIHTCFILLNSREFPQVMRHGSSLVLVDFSSAVFERRKGPLKEEFDYLVSLCKKEEVTDHLAPTSF